MEIIVPQKLGALLGTFYVLAWHSGETFAIRADVSLLTECIVLCKAVIILFRPLFTVTTVRRIRDVVEAAL